MKVEKEKEEYRDYGRVNSIGLSRQVSDVLFKRQSSANEFLDDRRTKYEMVRNASIEDNHR